MTAETSQTLDRGLTLLTLLADHPEYADLYKTPPTRTRTLRVNVPKTGE